MNDQAQIATNMLKYQIENNQRETEYYKKQVDVLKSNQQQSEERANQASVQYEQRLNYLQLQNRSYQ